MKRILILSALLPFFAMAQTTYNVTFSVDMSNYPGTFTESHLNGTFNNWCGTCNQLTDPDGDMIFEATIPLPADSHEYKFTLDGWTNQEFLTPGDFCTLTTGTFTNRLAVITSDTVLATVCWESCSSCSSTPVLTQVDLPITFDDASVNYTTSDFGGNASVVAADPAGGSNQVLEVTKDVSAVLWAGTTLSTPLGLASAIPVTATNSQMTVDVYSPDAGIPVRLKIEDHTDGAISVETEATTTVANGWETLTFDFTNEVSGTPAIDYAQTYDLVSIFFNFGTDGATAGTKVYYCDNIQMAVTAPTQYNVTFQVDMSDYTQSYNAVNLNGDFNGWCGSCATMTDDNNDMIYELTVPLEAGDIQYKFTVDGWTDQEELTGLTACTFTDSTFTNRLHSISGDIVLDVVCWESCEACALTTDELTSAAVQMYPNPVSTRLTIESPLEIFEVRVVDAMGRMVSAHQPRSNDVVLNTANWPVGIYQISILTEKGWNTERVAVSR